MAAVSRRNHDPEGSDARASAGEHMASAAEHMHSAAEHVASAAEHVADSAERVVDAVKPHLRGWLHTVTFPLAVIGGVALVVLAPNTPARVCAGVYTLTAALLFGTSGIYHRGSWSPRTHSILQRLDHANIFLIIAGTYTPLTALLLPERSAFLLLTVVWGGALVGVLLKVLWVGAPRWLSAPIYLALGWVATFYLGDFLRIGGVAVFVLVVVGGALYSLGALVYATRRPDPSPRWFGFHEVFHALTLAAFASHFAAITLVVARAE
jgi:hemolysin III